LLHGEVIKERLRGIRAARSYEHNRTLQSKVEARLEKARSTLESYLSLSEVTSMRLGNYQVELREGKLVVTRLPPDGWEQLELQELERLSEDWR